jgi:hypothetical protein
MPLPTIGLEAYRQLPGGLLFEGEVEGNWINRWNSLRSEGGMVWGFAEWSGGPFTFVLFASGLVWSGPADGRIFFLLLQSTRRFARRRQLHPLVFVRA